MVVQIKASWSESASGVLLKLSVQSLLLCSQISLQGFPEMENYSLHLKKKTDRWLSSNLLQNGKHLPFSPNPGFMTSKYQEVNTEKVVFRYYTW